MIFDMTKRSGGNDTGANGLYKKMVQGEQLPSVVEDNNITSIYTGTRLNPINAVGVKILRLPNLASITASGCSWIFASNTLRILEVSPNLNLSNGTVTNGLGFIKWANVPYNFKIEGGNNFGAYSCITLYNISHTWFPDLKTLGNSSWYNAGTGCSNVTIEFDSLTNLQASFGSVLRSTFVALIIRTPTLCNLNAAFNPNSDIKAGLTKIYVPASLAASYRTATNWSAYANQIIGIDEDTTGTVGNAFTSTTSATGIVSWDQVNLQTYSVGTVDSTTGEITPTRDGRILIRGLDADSNIVHVTYLKIGTGFDTEV